MLSKEKAVDRQMNDSVAERVASEIEAMKSLADLAWKLRGEKWEYRYSPNCTEPHSVHGKSTSICHTPWNTGNEETIMRFIAEAKNFLTHETISKLSTLTADNAAKDAEIARLKKSADAWDCLMNSMCAISALGDDQDATGDEKLNAYIDAWSKLKAQLAAVEAERDAALACLRRCAVTASNLTSDPDNVSAEDVAKIQHAMDNPLQADRLVNDRICELECDVAQKLDCMNMMRKDYNALRTELTALREAAEGAKAIIKPFLNDIGGLKGKFHRGEESNERGEALLKVYDHLTADIATTAISPAADEPIVVGGKVCKFYLNQFNRFKGRWSIHSGTYHMHLSQWTCKTDERDHFPTEQCARDFARQRAAKE